MFRERERFAVVGGYGITRKERVLRKMFKLEYLLPSHIFYMFTLSNVA